MGLWVFLGVAAGVVALILFLVALANKCDQCGSLNHAFSSDKVGDLETAKAFTVCKRCGAKKHQGTVSADGSVIWFSGGTGTFHEDGRYEGDGGGYADGGGDGGGGGE